MTAPIVLVVEDDMQIRRFVRSILVGESFQVFEADTVAQALIDASEHKPDLLILDLGLPDGDGVRLILELRAWSNLPVLVLSARLAEDEKIRALDAGADDYLTKPFSVGELLARARALLRRSRADIEREDPIARFGEVEVDMARRRVMRNGEPIHLTPIEYRLLCTLIANAGKVMTHRHLLRDVWGGSFIESSHYVRIYVGHLRQKLEVDPAQPRHLLTEIGVGYRFQP